MIRLEHTRPTDSQADCNRRHLIHVTSDQPHAAAWPQRVRKQAREVCGDEVAKESGAVVRQSEALDGVLAGWIDVLSDFDGDEDDWEVQVMGGERGARGRVSGLIDTGRCQMRHMGTRHVARQIHDPIAMLCQSPP